MEALASVRAAPRQSSTPEFSPTGKLPKKGCPTQTKCSSYAPIGRRSCTSVATCAICADFFINARTNSLTRREGLSARTAMYVPSIRARSLSGRKTMPDRALRIAVACVRKLSIDWQLHLCRRPFLFNLFHETANEFAYQPRFIAN